MNVPKPTRECADCHVDISGRGRASLRCKSCQSEWHRKCKREYMRAARTSNIEQVRAYQREYHRAYRADPAIRKRLSDRELARYHRLGGHVHRRVLPALIERQANICGLCNALLPSDLAAIHVDHILPASKGGTNDVSNLQAAHAFCNGRKHDRIVEQALRLV